MFTRLQDYSLRAKDYNAKKERLKLLRQKAAERNPDEFHFAMMGSRTDAAGRKIADRGNKILDHDTAKLLKTQDAGYLRTMAQKTRIAREKLEQELLLSENIGTKNFNGAQAENSSTDEISTSNRLVFVDSEADQRHWGKNDSVRSEPDLGRSEPRKTEASDRELSDEDGEDPEAEPAGAQADQRPQSRNSKTEEDISLKDARYQRKKRRRILEAKQSMLEALRERETSLLAAERELEMQRAKMSNTIGGTTKAGVKFKVRERKR